MSIHYMLLLIVFAGGYLYRKCRDSLKSNISNFASKVLLIIYVGLTVFIGFRNINIGTDTVTYVSLFWSKNYFYDNIEFIPQIISWIVRLFTDKYFIYLTVLSAISLFGIYFSCKEYKFDTEYFLFLYITSFCYLYSCSAIRFFCAFSILLIAFKYMIKGDTKKVIFLILIATMFHTSAIIFLPIYFLTKFKFNMPNLFLFILSCTFFILIEKLTGLNFLFDLRMFDKYTYVIENQNATGGVSFFINMAILIFSLMNHNQIKIYKKEYEFFVKMHIVGMTLDFIGIAYRVIWFFRFPIWFILPIFLFNLKNNNKKKDYMVIYIAFIFIYATMYYFLIDTSLSTNNFLNYEFYKLN